MYRNATQNEILAIKYYTAHVSGDELMRELGLEPGPPVGRLLEDLREAAFCGEVGSKREAIERARATTSARQGA